MEQQAPEQPGDPQSIQGAVEAKDSTAPAASVGAEAAEPTTPLSTPTTPIRNGDERFHLLVSSVKDYAIFLLDPSGNVVSWNEGAQRIKGYRESEILGKHFSVFYTPEDIARRIPWRALEVAASDGRFHAEGWRVRKDGARFWGDVTITALRDPEHRLVGFGKVTRDLTEHRLAEEALRQSEARFRMLVEGVRDYAILMLDPGGYIQSWNEGARQLEGYQADEILGKHFSIFFPPEDVERGKPVYELAVASSAGQFEEEGWRVRKDGTHFWANVLITALRDTDGRLVGFGKITRDLTERRRADEDRRRLLEEQAARHAAELSVRLRDQFLSVAAHELKTPVTSLRGYAQLVIRQFEIGRALDAERTSRAMRIIEQQSEKLGRLVNQLLDVSRLEAGRLMIDPQPTDVAELLEALVASARVNAPKHALSLESPPSLPARVDPLRFEQVVTNLLDNAIIYSPEGGAIHVRLSRPVPEVFSLTVRDFGIGIAPEHRERIFDRFNEAHSGTHLGGIGLGLYISREIVHMHGGTIEVEAPPEGGSLFRVTLPIGG